MHELNGDERVSADGMKSLAGVVVASLLIRALCVYAGLCYAVPCSRRCVSSLITGTY